MKLALCEYMCNIRTLAEIKEMDNDFEGRTNQKLEFAALSLKEITSRTQLGSTDDFERSHEENFLYHLIGAKDSFCKRLTKHTNWTCLLRK